MSAPGKSTFPRIFMSANKRGRGAEDAVLRFVADSTGPRRDGAVPPVRTGGTVIEAGMLC